MQFKDTRLRMDWGSCKHDNESLGSTKARN